MENKQLVLLKIVVSNHDNHRLILLNRDYKSIIEGKKFNRLTIEFDDKVIIDFTKSITLYNENGTLAQKGRISAWIEKKGYLANANEVLLLFELTINEAEKTHSYRFLGDTAPLYEDISNFRKGKIE